MKLLYISEYLVYDKPSGAKSLAHNHLNTIRELLDEDSVFTIALIWNKKWKEDDAYICMRAFHNFPERIRNLIQLNSPVLNNTINEEIVTLIKTKNIDTVLLNNSYFGKLIKRIKKECPNVKVYAFYHGVQLYTWLIKIKNNPKLALSLPQVFVYALNEYWTTKYADKNILLNERDNTKLMKYYHKKADLYLPAYFSDKKIDLHATLQLETDFSILFVGGYFWPNVLGIKWFQKEVMPYLPEHVRLYVVGNGMEQIEDDITDSRIRVIGRVDQLDPWYNSCNLVIGPIFHGDGMKTKTAEAMMYGKIYLGTNEAFEGYVGMEEYKCNTAEEFVQRITNCIESKQPKFVQSIRENYLQNYSEKMAKKFFSDLFMKK